MCELFEAAHEIIHVFAFFLKLRMAYGFSGFLKEFLEEGRNEGRLANKVL